MTEEHRHSSGEDHVTWMDWMLVGISFVLACGGCFFMGYGVYKFFWG